MCNQIAAQVAGLDIIIYRQDGKTAHLRALQEETYVPKVTIAISLHNNHYTALFPATATDQSSEKEYWNETGVRAPCISKTKATQNKFRGKAPHQRRAVSVQ